ncbi:hypothetical protein C8J56DRAFT_1026570 [Mycena floridula]|nr:hypothetical protein C8J56DRAFT_1026570 [Mycena floridula]
MIPSFRRSEKDNFSDLAFGMLSRIIGKGWRRAIAGKGGIWRLWTSSIEKEVSSNKEQVEHQWTLFIALVVVNVTVDRRASYRFSADSVCQRQACNNILSCSRGGSSFMKHRPGSGPCRPANLGGPFVVVYLLDWKWSPLPVKVVHKKGNLAPTIPVQPSQIEQKIQCYALLPVNSPIKQILSPSSYDAKLDLEADFQLILTSS